MPVPVQQPGVVSINKIIKICIGSIVIGVFLFFCCNTQHSDIRQIQDSLSNFYRIFDVEAIKDLKPAVMKLFGLLNGPEKVIEPEVTIQLAKKVIVGEVGIDHIPKSLTPDGDISSAPKDFEAWSSENLYDQPFLIGRYTFTLDQHPAALFKAQNRSSLPHRYVHFIFLENQGHPNETCVYRLRVYEFHQD